MTCYLAARERGRVEYRRVMWIADAGLLPAGPVARPASRGARGAVVRVTHASVGATDVMAMAGEYLLHPRRGLVAGYDLVGVVEHLPPGAPSHLRVGQSVAAVLPRMGAHATRVVVAPSLLVPVPDGVDPATAATVPLDAVTARFALDAPVPGASASDAGSVLVQGAGGAVGAWAVQLATARGHRVHGTASPRSAGHAASLGATVLDYRDPAWAERLVELTGGGVAGAIDHTGDRRVRRAVASHGRLVRIAFGGAPGRRMRATASGFLATAARRYADPGERICSAPLLVAVRRAAYRRALAAVLDSVAGGVLVPPRPIPFPLGRYREAFAAVGSAEAGTKVVLVLDD